MTRPAAFSLILAALVPLSAEAHATRPAYEAIYDTILQADAASAAESCRALEPVLTAGSDAQTRNDAFVALAEGWGRVQAVYILGGYDANAMDYPILIDMFHHGKEDIHEKLARAIDSDNDPKTALFKNSYRTITALDDLMFSGEWSPRRAELAQAAAATVCERLETLRDGYAAHREDYMADPAKALSLLIDGAIQNVYKTRDWRIGQVVGLTRKTLGKTITENAQYPYNLEASWAAIGAMLDAHTRLFEAGDGENIATIAELSGQGSMDSLQAALTATQQAYAATTPADYTDGAKMTPLFSGLQKMQMALYDQVALSLGVSAGLVDADGD